MIDLKQSAQAMKWKFFADRMFHPGG